VTQLAGLFLVQNNQYLSTAVTPTCLVSEGKNISNAFLSLFVLPENPGQMAGTVMWQESQVARGRKMKSGNVKMNLQLRFFIISHP
jgi:hypothetical protein